MVVTTLVLITIWRRVNEPTSDHTNDKPSGVVVMAVGEDTKAEVPVPSALPAVPLPTTVETAPDVAILRMRWLPVSAT